MSVISPIVWRAPAHWSDLQGPRPLLMITTSYPATSTDLAGRFVHTLAQRLADAGHRIYVLTPAGPGPDRPPGWSNEPGPVHLLRVAYPGWRYGPFHTEGLPDRFERSWRYGGLAAFAPLPGALVALALATWLQACTVGPRLELVGHWLQPSGGLAQLCARLGGWSATTICHSGAVRLLVRWPRLVAAPLIHAGLGSGPFIATCSELVEQLEQATARPLAHRAHIAAMPIESPQRCGHPPSPPPFRVLTLSRHVPVKGLDHLIASASRWSGAVELQLAGDGPQREQLARQARALGTAVRFHGVVTGRAKSRLLSTCHGFALPSRQLPSGRTEGVPVALLEALAYRLPILATRVGGVPEALGLATDNPIDAAVTCEPSLEGLTEAWPTFLEQMARRWDVPPTPAAH
ncbi:MAG: glycosyltransferase [Myxococcota bacterium]